MVIEALNNANTPFRAVCSVTLLFMVLYTPIKSDLSRKHSTIAGARFSIGTLN